MACEISAVTARGIVVVGLFMAALALQPAAIYAGEMPTEAEVSAAVSDKTYQGSMLKDAFVEYYAPDGTIRADGYSGKWRAKEGAMCFQYGDKPERCFAVLIDGPAMTMYKHGKVDGNGILVDGNPRKF